MVVLTLWRLRWCSRIGEEDDLSEAQSLLSSTLNIALDLHDQRA